MPMQDYGVVKLFTSLAPNISPTGDLTFVGFIILFLFIYLCWSLGLTLVSVAILGFIAMAALSMMFGGIFTLLFYGTIAVLGMLVALIAFSRFARVN